MDAIKMPPAIAPPWLPALTPPFTRELLPAPGSVGAAVVGAKLGAAEGAKVGSGEGGKVGAAEGAKVGVAVVGATVGIEVVGIEVEGWLVGSSVGIQAALTGTPQLLHDAVEGNSMELKRGVPAKAFEPMDTVFSHPATNMTIFNEEHPKKA